MKATKAFVLGVMSTLLVLAIVGFAPQTLEITWHQVGLEYNGESLHGDDDPFYYNHHGKRVPLTFLHEGTTYVPLRFIAESFDKEVSWDASRRTVVIQDHGQVKPEEEGEERVKYTVITHPTGALKGWVDGRLTTEGQHLQVEEDGKTYILIARGEMNTGGYGVEVEHVTKREGRLFIAYRYIDPAPEDFVTMAITHPYILLQVEGEWQLEAVQFERFTPPAAPLSQQRQQEGAHTETFSTETSAITSKSNQVE